MNLYLAGPMTGYEEWNFPAFHAVCTDLRSIGHAVLNPAENDDGDASAGDWSYFMRQDIAHVLSVDAVAVLPGWERSRGATLEVTVAVALGLPILDCDTLDPIDADAVWFAVKAKPERAALLRWLREEWRYADGKFDDQRPGHDTHMRTSDINDDGWWFNQVFQYVARARVLGLGNPLGRQAIAKCWAAMSGLVESVIRIHGGLPPAGVPSGYLPDEVAS